MMNCVSVARISDKYKSVDENDLKDKKNICVASRVDPELFVSLRISLNHFQECDN